MKKSAFLIMIVLLIIGSCVEEEVNEKSPLEGAWELVYGSWIVYEVTFPEQVQGGGTKLWIKEHFAFINRFRNDEATLETTDAFVDYYGWGTYELNGDRYKQHRELHSIDEIHGTSTRMLLEIRNDTLIQKWPVDENWMLPEEYNHEKWIRLE